jgi:asparagine synthase (glutamine-hydrolysing)
MSMACGLEVRVPFCDHRIAEYAYNIPWEMKSFAGEDETGAKREKALVRKAMKGVLPADVLRRKKSPYPKTHNPNYVQKMREMFTDMINSPDAAITEIYDMDKLRELAVSEKVRGNWYGQLMQYPQTLAYLLQFETLLQKYRRYAQNV